MHVVLFWWCERCLSERERANDNLTHAFMSASTPENDSSSSACQQRKRARISAFRHSESQPLVWQSTLREIAGKVLYQLWYFCRHTWESMHSSSSKKKTQFLWCAHQSSLLVHFKGNRIESRSGMNRDPCISQALYPMKLWLRQRCGKQACVMNLKSHGGQCFKVKLKKTASVPFSPEMEEQTWSSWRIFVWSSWQRITCQAPDSRHQSFLAGAWLLF